MSPTIRRIGYLIQSFGVDPRKFGPSLASIPTYIKAYTKVRKLTSAAWPIELMPALGDRGETAGSATGHYFHMDLWAARQVFAGNFRKVVDIGSRMDGYVAHVLSFRDIEVFDVRPLPNNITGMVFTQADMMNPASLPENYADCVTSLHAIEHFGLGRYGDPIDLDGWARGLASFSKILAPKGTLLLAVPVGRQRIEFDAHRVFDPRTIMLETDKLGLELISFSGVNDKGEFIDKADPDAMGKMHYGCGCFVFKKL